MRETYLVRIVQVKRASLLATPLVFLFASVLKQIKSELKHFSFCEAANRPSQEVKLLMVQG